MVARVMTYMYNTTEAGDSSLENALKDYVTFQINSMNVATVCNCLGEPKFNAVSWNRKRFFEWLNVTSPLYYYYHCDADLYLSTNVIL